MTSRATILVVPNFSRELKWISNFNQSINWQHHMKDHVQVGHETRLSTLNYSSKSMQTSLILRKRPPKPYKLLKFVISFVTTVKSHHAPTIWKKLRWKLLCLPILKSIMEIIKNLQSLYDFGGCCLTIRNICMDFEPYFKVHNLISVHPKSIILGQMTNLNIIFHVVASVDRFVKIWNSSQFPAEFRSDQ